jgi:group I intron endonuclease
MSGIYKITNPKGKVYIGQSVNVLNRKKYYSSLRCKNQTKLYNSLKKYGIENHIFETICYCEVSELNELERYYQDLYNVIENGLNCRLTFSKDKSGCLSEETKTKIRNANIGKTVSSETKLKISQNTKKGMTKEVIEKMKISRKNYKLSNETKLKIGLKSKGRFHTSETKEKLSKSRFNSNNPNAKIVLDYNTGVFYNTSKEASDILGINKSTLRHYLSGRIKQDKYNLKYV